MNGFAIYNTVTKKFLPPISLRTCGWWSSIPGDIPRIFTQANDARKSMVHWLKGEPVDDGDGNVSFPQPRRNTAWTIVPVRVEIVDTSRGSE